ncbi:unnamed protein product [Ectocarpus sp. 6 AP-2014]
MKPVAGVGAPAAAEAVVATEPSPTSPTVASTGGGAASGGSLGSYFVRTSFRRTLKR